jgi:hypothetical protein
MPHKEHSEFRDIPFLKNDMNSSPSTMDKPLDTSDAPGKADSEIGQEEETPAGVARPR